LSRNQGKDYSASQENDIARLLGGRVQSNSGGTRFGGGDVHTSEFFIEAKTPTKSQTSFSIKQEWIDKMCEQAFEQGKYNCALAFRFAPDGNDYFVINSRLMKQLVEYLERGVNNG
jgi:hypothetical protein